MINKQKEWEYDCYVDLIEQQITDAYWSQTGFAEFVNTKGQDIMADNYSKYQELQLQTNFCIAIADKITSAYQSFIDNGPQD